MRNGPDLNKKGLSARRLMSLLVLFCCLAGFDEEANAQEIGTQIRAYDDRMFDTCLDSFGSHERGVSYLEEETWNLDADPVTATIEWLGLFAFDLSGRRDTLLLDPVYESRYALSLRCRLSSDLRLHVFWTTSSTSSDRGQDNLHYAYHDPGEGWSSPRLLWDDSSLVWHSETRIPRSRSGKVEFLVVESFEREAYVIFLDPKRPKRLLPFERSPNYISTFQSRNGDWCMTYIGGWGIGVAFTNIWELNSVYLACAPEIGDPWTYFRRVKSALSDDTNAFNAQAIIQDDTLHVIFVNGEEGEVWAIRSSDLGDSWSEPSIFQLPPAFVHKIFPAQLSPDGDITLFVESHFNHENQRKASLVVTVQTGGQWGQPMYVPPLRSPADSLYSTNPAATVVDSLGLYVIWTQFYSPQWRTLEQRAETGSYRAIFPGGVFRSGAVTGDPRRPAEGQGRQHTGLLDSPPDSSPE